ncbi:MAG: hypothetical protein ABI702_02105 [Burkholderiales bacterium]
MRAGTFDPGKSAWRNGLLTAVLTTATLGPLASAEEAVAARPPGAVGSAASASAPAAHADGGARPPDPARHFVQAALDDAALLTGIAAADLKVAGVERVTWLDGSLGCPEPDVFYTQALVPGFRIRIDAGGALLDYHTDTRGRILLCPAGRAVAPAAQARPVRRVKPAMSPIIWRTLS